MRKGQHRLPISTQQLRENRKNLLKRNEIKQNNREEIIQLYARVPQVVDWAESALRS